MRRHSSSNPLGMTILLIMVTAWISFAAIALSGHRPQVTGFLDYGSRGGALHATLTRDSIGTDGFGWD
jgi:hypothetical protein